MWHIARNVFSEVLHTVEKHRQWAIASPLRAGAREENVILKGANSMKKANWLKLLALAMAVLMMATLFVGCGGKVTDTSDPTSDEDPDDFGDDSDIEFSVDDSDESGVSQQGSKGNTGSIQTNESITNGKENSDGLKYSDNETIFKNIPGNIKGKTVKFADWGEASADEYQKVVKKFTQVTGIKVETLLYQESNFITNVATQIAAGNSPDIAASNSTFPAALEVVQPLPKIFNINDGFWDKRCSEATKVGNKYYFVNTINSPFTGGYVCYYNKKIYGNNGLTSPQDYLDAGKWTYENMYVCMQDAVKLGYNGGILECMTLAEQMGTSLINYDQKTGTFKGMTSDQNLIDALQFMAKAVDEGLAGGYGITSFASGQIGICMAGTYGLKYNGYFKNLAPSDIGVVPLPDSYKGKKLQYMPLGYRGYGICKGAANPDGAYYFLRYFLDLDKYEDAGAVIFANKVLEKYFRGTQLVLFQNSTLYFEYFQGALNLIGKGWSSASEWSALRHASVSQVAVELAARQNITDTAAKTATEKVKEFTKA